VAEYWEQHYDIANILRENWNKIGSSLNGKIHLTVGTADTFHLDESARLLQQTIQDLGGNASFTYFEGRSHFDLYQDGLLEQIAKEMYALARPNGNSQLRRHSSPATTTEVRRTTPLEIAHGFISFETMQGLSFAYPCPIPTPQCFFGCFECSLDNKAAYTDTLSSSCLLNLQLFLVADQDRHPPVLARLRASRS
jgi:hypothetical protein